MPRSRKRLLVAELHQSITRRQVLAGSPPPECWLREPITQAERNDVRAGYYRVDAIRCCLQAILPGSIEQRGGVGENGHKRDAGCQAEGCAAGGKDESVHRLHPFSGLDFALLNPEPTRLYAEGHNSLCASGRHRHRGGHRGAGRPCCSALPPAITPQAIGSDRSSAAGEIGHRL